MPQSPHRRFLGLTLAVMAGWTLILGGSLFWELRLLDEQAKALARFEGAAAFERDIVYRLWNARMGGVYALTDYVEPNPYLDVEHRDLETEIGRLTMVNPSYMTRIVHGIAAERTGIVSHITSLDPIRPANAAAPWERDALERFETGATEYASTAPTADGQVVMRFMRPLMVEEPCLACHEVQGYSLGQVRGGISVTVPMAPIDAIQAPNLTFSVAGHIGVWLLGMAGLGFGGGAMSRLVGRLEDARDSAETERARAESADAAKSRFLATMSHELRTPLNAILGFSDMMRQRLLGPLGTEKYGEYAEDIHHSGEYLLALINDVLDLSRIEAGRMVLSDDRVMLGDMVHETLGVVRPQAQARGVRLDVDIDPDMPPLRADSRLVKQMLLNLLSNAVRFTPDGGRILVTANLDAQKQPIVAVSDTGPGIPEGELEAVLEPFRQGSMVEGAAIGGTGLGLSLVKRFIELHGGTMRLISRVGVGTTVALLFPAHRSLIPAE